MKKILALVIGVTFISTGWQYMFDYEGFVEREEQEKIKEKIRKEETEKREYESTRKSLENIIKDIHFTNVYCDGRKGGTWLVACFDRAKKDLPRYTIRGEIYTVSNFDPYVFDFYINKSTNTLSGSSNCNGFSSCTYKKIERPRVRTPDKHMKWAIDAEKRYKEITEDQIAKVVIQFRDNYDYEKIWFTKIYKDF